MKTYDITGRYGISCTIKQIDDSHYGFKSKDGFVRMGQDADGHMSFVDPSGGPMIALQDRLCEIDRRLPDKLITEMAYWPELKQTVFTVK